MKNKTNIFWGVVLVILAVLVVVSEMGFIEGVGLWTIVFSIVFGAALIHGIVKFDFAQILFSIAFLCIVWDDMLGITKITPWPILLAALLGSIGCNLIFGNSKGRSYKKKYEKTIGDFDTKIEQESGEEVDCSVTFSSTVKYINSSDLKNVNVSASFGAVSLYFDNAAVPSGEVLVNINASFAGVELFIPRDWCVTNQVNCMFGGIDEENRGSGVNAVKVVLVGAVNFAGVEITYI